MSKKLETKNKPKVGRKKEAMRIRVELHKQKLER